jgi:hypothetical protein
MATILPCIVEASMDVPQVWMIDMFIIKVTAPIRPSPFLLSGHRGYSRGISVARIIENTGRSMEEALVIVDAEDHLDGIAAEYRYLAEKFGQQGKDWNLVLQSLVEQSPGILFDMMVIGFPDGRVETLYFDIRAFFSMA